MNNPTTIPAKPLTYDLVELVIHFGDNNTESMIVSLNSFAHEAVKDYAKINGYKLDCLTPDESTLVI
jgi:predicted nucleic-acid-binding protein